jgi:ubiquinone/menaquinone biosynthesis C-methylase UbiE
MVDRELSRSNLSKYTLRALKALPALDNPLILDIGCGSGIPTITLAKATGGSVIGIDNNKESLNKLREKLKIEKEDLQVKALYCDFKDLPFDNQSFDIIWAEGSIAAIGFEQGIQDWKKLLKPSGFMVIHDDADDLEAKKEAIKKYGYKLLDSFILYENIWWDEYYADLDRQIGEHYLDGGLPIEGEALEIFKEIEMYRSTPERFRSVYFIMQGDR